LSNQIKSNGYKANVILSNLQLANTPEQAKAYMDDYAAIRQANADAYARFEKLPQDEQSKALYQAQFQARSAYGNDVRQFFDLMKANQQQQARELYQGDMAHLQADYYTLVDKMVDYQAKSMQDDVSHATEESNNAKLQMALLSVFAVVLALATAVVITRSITGPIKRAVALAEGVASGNLTHRLELDSHDEIGRLLAALKQMIENLHGIVAKVRTGTDTIATASREVASGNLDLSGRTERQAGALEETAAAIEQLTSTVKQNADNAMLANKLASDASAVAGRGGDAVDQGGARPEGHHESRKDLSELSMSQRRLSASAIVGTIVAMPGHSRTAARPSGVLWISHSRSSVDTLTICKASARKAWRVVISTDMPHRVIWSSHAVTVSRSSRVKGGATGRAVRARMAPSRRDGSLAPNLPVSAHASVSLGSLRSA